MHTFPHLVNGPINEQQLLQVSGLLIEEGLPQDATPGQARRFLILQRRHVALQEIADAYESIQQRSLYTCLVAGRYYANLERAIGSYRSALILAQIA